MNHLDVQQAAAGTDREIEAEKLGSAAFKRNYRLRFAYAAGSMYKEISSSRMVAALAHAGLMGYLGTGGVSKAVTEASIQNIRESLPAGASFGVNVLADPEHPEVEDELVDLLLRHDVEFIEASAFMQVMPSLVHYRMKGLQVSTDGSVRPKRRILAKISRPEVAEMFMRPPQPALLRQLVERGLLTDGEGRLAEHVPVAHEVCAEADSAGHTDRRSTFALLPAIRQLADRITRECRYTERICVGAAGGIGAPEAAAAAFVMGADFVMTGSINQCTVEAGTSDAVKDLLQGMGVQDTDYAPAGDMFEFGAKVQVLRKGVLFPARANKLFELYQRHESIETIDPKTRAQIEDKYFRRTFVEVWDETRRYWSSRMPELVIEAERNPKKRMAMIFRWYFVHSTRLAMSGDIAQKVDYQVHCGPALGAFNQWVQGTDIEDWRARRVADIAERLMVAAARLLNDRFEAMRE